MPSFAEPSLKKKIYLLSWLYWILVLAHRIFSCSM